MSISVSLHSLLLFELKLKKCFKKLPIMVSYRNKLLLLINL